MKISQPMIGLGLVALLSACGGGGSSSPATSSATFTGTVIDGAIEGASVCLDLNNSLTCDSGEPSATTKADGTYSLVIDGLTTAQIRSAHLITTVPVTAKDADDGGKTLAQAGKSEFNLMAPAEAFMSTDGKTTSAVVSPLTTMVSHEMMSGSGKSVDAAKAAVATTLGLTSGTQLLDNFVGKTDVANVELHKQAQFLAVALGEVKNAIKVNVATSTSRDQQLGALNYVKTNATALMAVAKAATGNAPIDAFKASLANSAMVPVAAADLVIKAKDFVASSASIDAVSSDWGKVIDDGFYNAYCWTLTASGSSGTTTTPSTNTCAEWRLSKVIGNGPGKFTSEQFVSANATWVIATPSPTNTNYVLAATGWIIGDGGGNGTYASDGAGGMTVKNTSTGSAENVRLTIKDVSGKKVSDLIDPSSYNSMFSDLDLVGGGALTLPATFKNTLFPAGSQRYAFKMTFDTDQYRLWSYQARAYNYLTNAQTYLSNFDELIAAYADKGASGGTNYINFWILNSSLSPYVNTMATFDAGGTAAKGTLSVWKQDTVSPFAKIKQTEKGSYEIRTVLGQQILVILPPPSVLSARNGPQEEQTFAVRDGKLYLGSYETAAARNALHSGGSNWNPVAMRALLAGAGLPTAK